MGKDIRGWVEVRRHYEGVKPPYNVSWYGVIVIGNLLDRNYDMFGSLFGVTTSRFTPIAPNRGLPSDISEQATDDYLTWECAMGETWVSWREIQAIAWDEEAVDYRPHEYIPDETGQLFFVSRANPRAADPTEEGSTWQIGASVFRVEKISRNAFLRADWRLLFRLMEDCAAEYGEDCVRLVAWFDY